MRWTVILCLAVAACGTPVDPPNPGPMENSLSAPRSPAIVTLTSTETCTYGFNPDEGPPRTCGLGHVPCTPDYAMTRVVHEFSDGSVQIDCTATDGTTTLTASSSGASRGFAYCEMLTTDMTDIVPPAVTGREVKWYASDWLGAEYATWVYTDTDRATVGLMQCSRQ